MDWIATSNLQNSQQGEGKQRRQKGYVGVRHRSIDRSIEGRNGGLNARTRCLGLGCQHTYLGGERISGGHGWRSERNPRFGEREERLLLVFLANQSPEMEGVENMGWDGMSACCHPQYNNKKKETFRRSPNVQMVI